MWSAYECFCNILVDTPLETSEPGWVVFWGSSTRSLCHSTEPMQSLSPPQKSPGRKREQPSLKGFLEVTILRKERWISGVAGEQWSGTPLGESLADPLEQSNPQKRKERKKESQVIRSWLTLCNPMDYSLTRLLCPWGFSRQEYWSGLAFPSPTPPEVTLKSSDIRRDTVYPNGKGGRILNKGQFPVPPVSTSWLSARLGFLFFFHLKTTILFIPRTEK